MTSAATPPGDDFVLPFRVGPVALRGRLVRLGPAIDRILSERRYPEPVASLLAEAVTLATLLAKSLKYEGIFTLQTKGDGPLRLLVADVSSEGALRGYARYDEGALAKALLGADAEAPVPRLLGRGVIAFTVDQGERGERYQRLVELSGATLAECAQHYFRQSEQLQAGLKLAAGRPRPQAPWRAGGLMLQRLPPEGGFAAIADDLEDAWRRAMVLMSSASSAELIDPDLPAESLLFRLFHEDGVRVYRTHRLLARCRCSRRKIEEVLKSFSQETLGEMRDEGAATITCEFCNARYIFDKIDLDRLIAA